MSCGTKEHFTSNTRSAAAGIDLAAYGFLRLFEGTTYYRAHLQHCRRLAVADLTHKQKRALA